ncbi:MAG: cell wall hydrolase [Rhodospirillales bacterium]|nr:cell wall hydrolase [Rhodospirillales bacterium]
MTFTAADIDATTRTVWGEARGEGLAGWVAVIWVILNRARHPAWWGATPAQVCEKPEQFSCRNANDPNDAKLEALSPTDPAYVAIETAVRAVFGGHIPDPTHGADHYEVIGTKAPWARGRTPSATIGHHAFYALGPSA